MKQANAIKETATYEGGIFTLTGAAPGGRTFGVIGINTGERMHYFAQAGEAWEVGIGVWDSSSTLERFLTLASSTGSLIDFEGMEDLTVAQAATAGTMFAIDGINENSATAHGFGAMAGGPDAAAWGAASVAIGEGAQVGSSSFPRSGAVALGLSAQVTHDGAVAMGRSARSAIPFATHGRNSFQWSGDAWTSDATPAHVAGPTSSPIELPEGTTVAVRAIVIGHRSADGAVYSAEVVACIRRTSGDAALVGSATTTEIAKTGGVTATATIVAGPSGLVAVQVTGAASEGWAWAASVSGVFVWP